MRLSGDRDVWQRGGVRRCFFFSSRRRHTRLVSDWSSACALPICPWTLAAMLQLTRSIEPALGDEGAVSDLIASLAEGVSAHVADVRKRIPGATILLQVDERSEERSVGKECRARWWGYSEGKREEA